MVLEVREYFAKHYRHVNLSALTDVFIRLYMESSYLQNLSFERKMDCLYDYIISNDLTEVQK